MKLNRSQVFLVQGQMGKLIGEGDYQLAPFIEKRVVIATDSQAAYVLLKEKDPQFYPIGHTSLKEYEDAAKLLRDAIKGESIGLQVYISPSFSKVVSS